MSSVLMGDSIGKNLVLFDGVGGMLEGTLLYFHTIRYSYHKRANPTRFKIIVMTRGPWLPSSENTIFLFFGIKTDWSCCWYTSPSPHPLPKRRAKTHLCKPVGLLQWCIVLLPFPCSLTTL